MQEKQAEQLYQELIASYLASPHRKKVDVIQKAYNFACRAHEGVSRPNGEPYIIHPLEVALIVSREMGLGSTSICAALLHDIIENTDYTVEDIENILVQRLRRLLMALPRYRVVSLEIRLLSRLRTSRNFSLPCRMIFVSSL
jgi:GTP pyrophosphokinase